MARYRGMKKNNKHLDLKNIGGRGGAKRNPMQEFTLNEIFLATVRARATTTPPPRLLFYANAALT